MIKSIKWQRTGLVCLLLFVAVRSQAQFEEPPNRPMDLRITAMRAMLFFENTGSFSPDVFTNEVNLWNTVIEGASRDGASESMLVVVEVKADGAGRYPIGRRVQLSARYQIENGTDFGKPAFFNKTMKISIGSADKFFAGFWLYGTGCYPVKLSARIVGQQRWLRQTINLRCGE
jgi:hypothetical protein